MILPTFFQPHYPKVLRFVFLHNRSSTSHASYSPAKKRVCVYLSRWVVIKLPFGKEYLYIDSGQAALGESLHAVLDTVTAWTAVKPSVCL